MSGTRTGGPPPRSLPMLRACWASNRHPWCPSPKRSSATWPGASMPTTSGCETTGSRASWASNLPTRIIAGASPIFSRANAGAEIVDGGHEPYQVFLARQAMIAVLDQLKHDLGSGKTLRQAQRSRVGNVRVGHPVEQSHRASKRDV